MVANLSMKSYERCHLPDEKVSPTPNLPLGVCCTEYVQPTAPDCRCDWMDGTRTSAACAQLPPWQ